MVLYFTCIYTYQNLTDILLHYYITTPKTPTTIKQNQMKQLKTFEIEQLLDFKSHML